MRRSSASGPRDATAFEVRDALTEPGCPICGLAVRSVGRFLSSLAYERVNDLDIRANLRAARGFCNPHAFRWLREAHNVLGTALIYRDIIRTALADVTAAGERSRGGLFDRLRGRTSEVQRVRNCLACVAQREAEARYLDALATILREPSGVALLDAAEGLCLSHTLAAARLSDRVADIVVRHARARTERLVATLDEVIRKEDYRFRHEPRSEAERQAPADAVAWVIGRDGLVGD